MHKDKIYKNKKIRLLATVGYFSSLDETALNYISSVTIQQNYRAGEFPFMEGEPCIGLYIVKSGWLRAVKIAPNGREQVIRFVGPGDVFNEVGVLTGGVNIITVEALEDATVLIVQQEALLKLVDKYPSLAKLIIKNLAHRVLYAMDLVTDLSLRSVESRLARFLIKESRENIINRQKWATQVAIAARLGTVPVVINRAFRALVEDDLIKLEREKIIILNYEKLEKIALIDE